MNGQRQSADVAELLTLAQEFVKSFEFGGPGSNRS